MRQACVRRVLKRVHSKRHRDYRVVLARVLRAARTTSPPGHFVSVLGYRA